MNERIARSIAILCFFCLFTACSSGRHTAQTSSVPTILWQDKPVAIDGQYDDWDLPYSFMDSKAKIEYSFSNDQKNLYLTIKSSDRMTQLKILRAGMNVWIDPYNKKEKTLGILYPHENTEPMDMHTGTAQEGEQRGEAGQRMNKLISEARDYSLQGFSGCNGAFMISQHNDCGIETKIGKTDDVLIWEAKIPFRSFYKETLDKSDLGHAFDIGFEIHALHQPASSGEHSGGGSHGGGGGHGGMGGGGRGGMGGGGGHSGMGGSGMNDRQALFEPSRGWVRIHLAYKA